MAAAVVDSPNTATWPESPMEQDDVYPCKGCGDILEEGKAFELAGNRWHIDCFRCNTCGTLLDSDANLLLLGDGSLICNNCTYSCSACGNKIEDLAILTGDQAFCSGCFRCRNCKRKIENLRYARTSQGIFCMSCHETLMARRRKRARTPKQTPSSTPGAEKALPSLPPGAASSTAFTPEEETPPETTYAAVQGVPGQHRPPMDKRLDSRNGGMSSKHTRDVSPLSDDTHREGPTLPASTYNDGRLSNVASNNDDDDGSERGFLPMAFDPTPVNPPPQSTQVPAIPRKQIGRASPQSSKENQGPRADYFGTTQNGRLSAKAPKDVAREEQRPGTASSRSVSTEREQPANQAKPSPHILYQEKGRTSSKKNTSGPSTPANGSTTASPVIANAQERAAKQKAPPLSTDTSTLTQQDGFKLQDVPRSAKERSRAGSRAGQNSPAVTSPVDGNGKDTSAQAVSPVSAGSQNSGVNPFDDPRRQRSAQLTDAAIPPKHAERGLPLRGDSLGTALQKTQVLEQDPATPTGPTTLNKTQTQISSHERNRSTSSVPSVFTDAQSNLSRDNSSVKADSTVVRHSFEAGPPPRAASRPSAPSKSVANDDFMAPRHAPPAPPSHKHNESVSTLHSTDEHPGGVSPALRSAGLPKYSLDGGFSMEDEMGRILRGEPIPSRDAGASSPSVLRRVSNAVKHGRSFSDRAATAGNGSFDMSSTSSQTPNITSPTSADGLDALRASLRRAQNHIGELEAEKLQLQDKLEGSTEIKAVNTELREKRSTMAFLDTQREMIVRELEVMTEHLGKAKDNNQPLDLASLKTTILKDFAESLQKLKDQMGAQIEDLMHKRNELTDEIGNLIQMKDKGFQEYESLSTKNTQLLQHNNELIRSIQGMYQDNRQPTNGANGLGIYHPGAKLETSGEVRNLNIVSTDPSMPNLLHDPDAESATVLTAPQVVNIRKGGKPNKFNWRNRGEKITGKVTKGLKGAFVGEREQVPPGKYSIGMPYNQTGPQAMGGSEQSSIASKGTDGAGYGFFSQKNGGGKQSLKDNSSSNLVANDASVLFGSELAARCEHENRLVPGIVARCIQEVESRGMDAEGIYRKSGGAGQVKSVQQGFEKDNNFDISDQDLDIHAVTSALKQYFRKLPTPLIVYDVYESLLEAGQIQDREKQGLALRSAVSELPEAHRDCLEFLIKHLTRVMSYESRNLMTSLNLAVVFAPTIMRPLSIEREMSDMQAQRNSVQALLEQHKTVFGADD